jgi:hypothetical protein
MKLQIIKVSKQAIIHLNDGDRRCNLAAVKWEKG